MTDKEILSAMSDMLEPIRSDIQDMKGDIRELKEDVRVLQSDMEEVKDRVTRIELTQENIILPRLQNIENCYTSTYERYKESVVKNEELEQDVAVLKTVSTEHREILQRIS